MTALILVVDDIPANVKLLEAKLTSEYYNVITARDGFEALEQAKKHKPDLVLLDVMMPKMDGFTTCKHMKEDPEISHIPVVMVTALSEVSDRVKGLESGADDFITKPIRDAALFARVKSLIRIKVLLDELRLREKTGLQMGALDANQNIFTSDVSGAQVLVVNDDMVQTRIIRETLEKMFRVTIIHSAEEAKNYVAAHAADIDLMIVSTQLSETDGLRLAVQLKNNEEMRHVPTVMLVDEEETDLMLKGLELGVNDYLINPIDINELTARIKTQIRRKKYQDALKNSYRTSVSMAITDQLTGLYNRHYLDMHMKNMVQQARENQKPLSLLIMDMDHFKHVNDTYGHDVGDEVLKQLAEVIMGSIRSADTAARLGGEEFVLLMPETEASAAYDVADRMRAKIEAYEFKVSHEVGIIHKTLSIGMSTLKLVGEDSAQELVKRADKSLYEAKTGGRNRVLPKPAGASTAPAAAPKPRQYEATDTGF